ncbi:MAG: helix-turn-helix transcriptional regulator [Christensenellales bacterium]
MQGKTTKEIQQIAHINENTLKYHNRNLYGKLGVKSRKQLLMYAALMNQTTKKEDPRS